MAEHIASRKMYVLVFVSLILLTALTTAVAYVNLGPFNTVVALLIAMVKASLVGMFFMHLKWSSHLARLAALAALFWFAILIALSLSDYLTRNSPPPPAGWQAPSIILPRMRTVRTSLIVACILNSPHRHSTYSRVKF